MPEISLAINRWLNGKVTSDYFEGYIGKSSCSESHRFSYSYYADIKQTISASDQEMNSALAELSRVCPSSVYFLSVILTEVNVLWVMFIRFTLSTFAFILRIILEN